MNREATTVQLQVDREVSIHAGQVEVPGHIAVPRDAAGIVLFAHGSGSSRHSPRNRFVAERLHQYGFATLLFDLLTSEEENVDARTGHFRFDIDFLSERLVESSMWVHAQKELQHMSVGYFGASTGAAAALVAAARNPERVKAVVSRGGRPDMADQWLSSVQAPVLLIVGGNDTRVLAMNDSARRNLRCSSALETVEGASHLFEEPGALERVADLAGSWFRDHVQRG